MSACMVCCRLWMAGRSHLRSCSIMHAIDDTRSNTHGVNGKQGGWGNGTFDQRTWR